MNLLEIEMTLRQLGYTMKNLVNAMEYCGSDETDIEYILNSINNPVDLILLCEEYGLE